MLKKINIYYIFFSFFLYFVVFNRINVDDYIIYFTNLFSIVAFFLLVNFLLKQPESFFNKRNLTVLVFFYSFFFILLYTLISYLYRGDFFVFGDKDPITYHNAAIRFAENPVEGTNRYLEHADFEDLGALFVFGSLYSIFESHLIVEVLHLIVGLITAGAIYRIAKNIISNKYSFLCATVYSTSSFVLWFHSSGQKESFMVMLVVLVFDQYFKIQNKIRVRNLVLIIVLLLSLLLFRPILSVFCVISMGAAFFVSAKRSRAANILFTILIFAGILASYSYVAIYLDAQFEGGDIDAFLYQKEEMVKGSVQFTYTVNTLASISGPFPTIDPSKNNLPSLSFLSAGLIFRVFLSTAFIMGVFFMLRRKIKVGYALIFFSIIEMLSLTLIFESLELRKSLPHFPMIFIISFWFIDYVANKEKVSFKLRKRVRVISVLSLIPLSVMIVFWNYR